MSAAELAGAAQLTKKGLTNASAANLRPEGLVTQCSHGLTILRGTRIRPIMYTSKITNAHYAKKKNATPVATVLGSICALYILKLTFRGSTVGEEAPEIRMGDAFSWYSAFLFPHVNCFAEIKLQCLCKYDVLLLYYWGR